MAEDVRPLPEPAAPAAAETSPTPTQAAQKSGPTKLSLEDLEKVTGGASVYGKSAAGGHFSY